MLKSSSKEQMEVIQGRKRPENQFNYHLMSNNAVFPVMDNGKDEVVHYHSKVVKNKSPRLEPTIRPSNHQEPTKIFQGQISRPVNDSMGTV